MDAIPPDQGTFAPPPPPPQPNVPPPSQYFGDLYQNGAVLDPSSLGAMFAPDNGDFMMDDFGDPADSKRRRIARACDMCRKKKIKCDGKMPKCSHCENYKTECVFTHVEKKRSPPKGAKYIEGLENRLGRMEHLLTLSGLLAKDDEGRTDLGTLEHRLAQQQQATEKSSPAIDSETSAPLSPRDQNASQSQVSGAAATVLTPKSDGMSPALADEKQKEKPKADEVEALSDLMCSLVTNSCGETRYIGSSSGFSIFSPKGISWVNEKTGDQSFEKMLGDLAADDNKWIHWKPEIFGDIFARRIFTPLPAKADAVALLKDFFENFNNIFPLFHEPTFMHLVDLQYSQTPYEGSGWWASLNVALAIAYRIRVMSQVAPNEADSMGWQYFKNALAVQTELTMRNNDLLSVQALLGMALYLQGTPNPQPSFFLIAAALRLAHSLGLHKRGSGFNLNKVEDEQRKRVFWIGYMLDKDICLRSGRPPIQDDDDMNVELPSADPDDKLGNIPLADGKGQSNLFLLMVTFSTIASKVYKQLYSVKASKQSDGELLNTIGELDKELEEWKDSIPLDFRPEHEINASHTPLILHVVVLHFAYYNCLTTIHRMSVHHGYWTSRLSNYAIQGLNVRPLNPRVFSSAAVCVAAARASINLIKYVPHGDYAIVWLIIYYPVSALVTLFANVLQNPQDVRARADVKLMNSVVEFLPSISTEESSGSIRQMLHICVEFVRIAKAVLDKVDSEHHSRRKRKSASAAKSAQARRGSGAADATKRASHDIPRPLNLTGQPPTESPFTSPMFSDFGNDHIFNPDFSNSPYGSGLEGNGDMSGANSAANVSPRVYPNLPLGGDGMAPGYAFEGLDAQGGSNGMMPGMGGSSGGVAFPQQAFVPQDLWSIPMTFEWDWSEIANTGFPSEFGQNR